jgi:hypothetical protein
MPHQHTLVAHLLTETNEAQSSAFNPIRDRPRVCMPTSRDVTQKAFRCGLYEAQDILAETNPVDLIRLQKGWAFPLLEERQKKLLYHDISRRLAFLNPGLRRTRLTQEYELFIAVCQNLWDLLYINAIDGWKDYCKTTVCWIDEVWTKTLPDYKYLTHALEQYDHVFIGTAGAVAPLSEKIGKKCRWLPGAVDTHRFTPGLNARPRVIDVYSIGRRWPGIHGALLQAAEDREIFYVFDTMSAANVETLDPRQHRDLLANIAKRSRFFLVAPPKMDTFAHTGGQVEVGYRYFEGAAAGTVMIGQRPVCSAFEELFAWPDVVIEIEPDGSNVRQILTSLMSNPEQMSLIGRQNAAQALLHHDWIYRWKEIFRIAGVEPSEQMITRESRLKDLAALLTDVE